MAYHDFAWWYDELNAAADYNALSACLLSLLRENGIKQGIVADLGCGTGEVALRLADAGYDMIAVDASAEMLSVFSEKLERGRGEDVLLLCQDLTELDLFGTVHAAVSTFDTLNHLPPERLAEALRRTALFLEPGGLFLFDANTPYKQQQVLGDNCFLFEDGGFSCVWQNEYLPEIPATRVQVKAREDGQMLFQETFLEYEYSMESWLNLLAESGLTLLSVQDGERFTPIRPDSQRYLFAAQKPSK